MVLLVFADASTVALAATIYARVESSGSYKCTLVAACTKVWPARHVSIPRLELTAAVMAVQLSQVVQSAMLVRPTEVWYFTDRSAVLGKLKSDSAEGDMYESVRLAEILDKTMDSQPAKSS